MKKLRIHPELLALLQSNQLGTFTVPELTAAYRALPDCPHKTPKAARQFVYKNVLRLTEKGVLTRIESGRGKRPRYRYGGQLTQKEKLPAAPLPPTPAADTATEKTDKNTDAMSSLQTKLYHCNEELLKVMGETELYDDLCSEFPLLHGTVQQRYNDARDRWSKLLGRVRALESVISDLHQTARS